MLAMLIFEVFIFVVGTLPITLFAAAYGARKCKNHKVWGAITGFFVAFAVLTSFAAVVGLHSDRMRPAPPFGGVSMYHYRSLSKIT